ncbi:MAG: prenyltransferase/squalene oxidase repeat-containing protein [Oscillospiraceae bacterium]
MEALIAAIGDPVTLESEEAIAAAREAYDQLTDAQKRLVRNYDALTAAETALAELKKTDEDQAAADRVKALIDAIGTVTLERETAIREARTAYDALTDLQKKLVSNYQKLVDAESALAYLKLPHADAAAAYQSTGDYLTALGKEYTPTVGSIGGEWMVLGLARSGREVPAGYYDNVVSYVNQKIDQQGRLHSSKSTDNSRLILALTAMGKDVTDVGGHNLLQGLTDMKYVKKQGINGPIWALIALDCHGYEVPTAPTGADPVTRQKLIEAILDGRLADGGWSISGRVSDADMTGMAIQALAPYYKTQKEVQAAEDQALQLLSKLQEPDGGFYTLDTNGSPYANSESCAQVVVALTALGLDPHTDSRFIKQGHSVLDALCSYVVAGGGFCHLTGGQRNGMATEQGYYALTAYFRLKDGKTGLYDMSDVTIQKGNQEDPTKPTDPAKPTDPSKPTTRRRLRISPPPPTKSPITSATGDDRSRGLYTGILILACWRRQISGGAGAQEKRAKK